VGDGNNTRRRELTGNIWLLLFGGDEPSMKWIAITTVNTSCAAESKILSTRVPKET